jgi:hypothetical protein
VVPLAEGRVIRTVTVLSQTFQVGKRQRGLYLRLVAEGVPERARAETLAQQAAE